MSKIAKTPAIVRTALAMAGRFEAAVRRRRTMRALEGLPDYMLKDIGYGRDPVGNPSQLSGDLTR